MDKDLINPMVLFVLVCLALANLDLVLGFIVGLPMLGLLYYGASYLLAMPVLVYRSIKYRSIREMIPD